MDPHSIRSLQEGRSPISEDKVRMGGKKKNDFFLILGKYLMGVKLLEEWQDMSQILAVIVT